MSRPTTAQVAAARRKSVILMELDDAIKSNAGEGVIRELRQKLAAANLGSLGGKSGKGESKRRDPEHYQRLAEARKQARIPVHEWLKKAE